MKYASFFTIFGIALLASASAAPDSNSRADNNRPDIKQPQTTGTQKAKKLEYKTEHPIYRGEPLEIRNPIWDGKQPTLLLINSRDKQSGAKKNVLGTMSIESSKISSRKTGGAENGAQKK